MKKLLLALSLLAVLGTVTDAQIWIRSGHMNMVVSRDFAHRRA